MQIHVDVIAEPKGRRIQLDAVSQRSAASPELSAAAVTELACVVIGALGRPPILLPSHCQYPGGKHLSITGVKGSSKYALRSDEMVTSTFFEACQK